VIINLSNHKISKNRSIYRMATNARKNKMSGRQTEQYPFSWKICSGWDYSIGVADSAQNAVMANVMKFKVNQANS